MLIICDCNYIGYVCAYALSKGMSYMGGRTEVAFGFMKQLMFLFENFEPTQVAFCWDSRQNKRKELYPEYKGKRNKKKEERTEEEKEAWALVYAQFDDIKQEVLPCLGFSNVFEVTGYESDDLIAALVQKGHWKPEETLVISSDGDLYQLLDKCSMYAIREQQTTDFEIFRRHYGIAPDKWAMLKAMAGCSTDNVEGIGGIGEKKAISYLKGELSKGKMFMKIKQSEAIINRNLPLVRLPFAGTPTPRLRRNDLSTDRFVAVAEAYGMKSFLEDKNLRRWDKIIARME